MNARAPLGGRGRWLPLLALALVTACGGAPGAPAGPTPSATGASPPAASTTPPATTAAPPTTAPTTAAPTARPTGTTLPSELLGRVISRLPTQQRLVALTFDGGAGAQGAASILATLSADGVPASFFLTGTFARDNPSVARTVAARGYPLGNHTMTHPHLPQLTDAAVKAQLADGAAAIRAAAGVDPRPWFRFPFGDSDARTLGIVGTAGYLSVGWTVDTLGWEGTSSGITVASIVNRVLANLQPGEIVLMHLGANPDDGSTLDAQALPQVIAAVRHAGYGFTTVRLALAG